MSDKIVSEKIALVTGANRGLGFGTAAALGKLGYKVLMTGRTLAKVEEVAENLKREGMDIECYQCDVTNDEVVKKLAGVIRERWGHLEVLVNNAGVLLEATDPTKSDNASFLKVDPQVVLKSLNANSVGPLRMIQNFAPLMQVKNFGRIVNVSSGMGQLSDMEGKFPGYRMSKTALNALTVLVSKELAGTNIKVNAICPGWVKTDMGGPSATRTLSEGVNGIVWAATLADNGPTGGYFRDGEPIPW